MKCGVSVNVGFVVYQHPNLLAAYAFAPLSRRIGTTVAAE
jgi:hypothetical protein